MFLENVHKFSLFSQIDGTRHPSRKNQNVIRTQFLDSDSGLEFIPYNIRVNLDSVGA